MVYMYAMTLRAKHHTVAPNGSAPNESNADESIVTAVIVLMIIMLVTVCVAFLTKFLRGVSTAAEKIAPAFDCAAWLRLRQQTYMNPDETNPATRKPFTPCEAAARAVEDAGVLSLGAPCPMRRTPPAVSRQPPYIYFMAAQKCAN